MIAGAHYIEAELARRGSSENISIKMEGESERVEYTAGVDDLIFVRIYYVAIALNLSTITS